MPSIADFDDHLFASSSYYLSELLSEVTSQLGRKPTVAEFSELLLWGLRSSGDDPFADANTQAITSVQIKISRRGKIVLRAGDVVAIPSAHGDFHLAVFLVSNPFGDAFGILKGKHSLRPPQPGTDFAAFPIPVYSDKRNVVAGAWPVVGHDERLLAKFPTAPERYHFPDEVSEFVEEVDLDVPPLGRHGSAENPDGTMRDLSSQEAEAVRAFLRDATFIDESLMTEWLDETNSMEAQGP